MTTKFLNNNICTFKILLSWRFRRKKTEFLDDSPLRPQGPPPSKAEILFLLSSRRLWESSIISRGFYNKAFLNPPKTYPCFGGFSFLYFDFHHPNEGEQGRSRAWPRKWSLSKRPLSIWPFLRAFLRGGIFTRGNDIRVSPGMTVQWRSAPWALPLYWHAFVRRFLSPLNKGGDVAIAWRSGCHSTTTEKKMYLALVCGSPPFRCLPRKRVPTTMCRLGAL